MPITPRPSTTITEFHQLPGFLETLRSTAPPAGGVLSVYLATPIVPIAGRTYLVSFREGCKTLRESVPEEDLDRFDSAVARADQHLAEAFVPRHPGLALFSSAEGEYFFSAPLPKRPAEEFEWGPQPVIAPIEQVLEDYERIAVAVFDQRSARLYSVFLGALEERRDIESDVAKSDEARSRRGHVSRGARGGAMAAARFARYREDAVLEHTRRTASALMDLLRSRPFDRLLLAGTAESTARLREELPRPLRARLVGEVPLAAGATDAQALDIARAAAEASEREAERKMVEALIDSAGTSRTVVGLDATLAALSEGRVHHLCIADQFPGIGTECPTCGRLFAGPGPCPSCGGRTELPSDLRERITERALEQGARVEFVSGDAASLLMIHGGIGAWTRY